MSDTPALAEQRTFLGHPVGLYCLFFAEMWERFSYYGMRALLIFYMMKGFLGYGDSEAYGVYGAYTALVYMTPFFGGMLADKLLGARRAVVLGGLLMAAGHLLMTVEDSTAFFAALALLIIGNGFFKPNISAIVGTLYPEGSHKRDGGFTIFYMGVNLGAAMSPLLCGYIGETYGMHYGFGLATIGMLIGLAVFVVPAFIAQLLIVTGALAAAVGLFMFHTDNAISFGINIFVAVALLLAGTISFIALGRGGLPKEAGAPPDREKLRKPIAGLPAEWAVYLATILFIPVFTLFVSGFRQFTEDGKPYQMIPDSVVKDLESGGGVAQILAVVVADVSKPAGMVLMLSGIIALVYLGMHTFRLDKIRRERMFVVLILTFFSMLFWSFFEQAGSSLNNFADRNIDRVYEDNRVTASQVGTTIRIQPTQEQFGYYNGDDLFTMDDLTELRKQNKDNKDFEIDWVVAESNVGMGVSDRNDEIPASTFQSINPICIMIFGLVFTVLWGALGKHEPSTPFKFALGLLQLSLGFGAFWYGAQVADDRGMVALQWLFLGYLLHTTGELCLSPVGLSMITKLSPKYLVSTVMGNWFLATAFSQYLAGIISKFTGVEGHGGDGGNGIPAPIDTVNVYGDVFYKIMWVAMASALICFVLVPVLKRWMHEGVHVDDDGTTRELA